MKKILLSIAVITTLFSCSKKSDNRTVEPPKIDTVTTYIIDTSLYFVDSTKVSIAGKDSAYTVTLNLAPKTLAFYDSRTSFAWTPEAQINFKEGWVNVSGSLYRLDLPDSNWAECIKKPEGTNTKRVYQFNTKHPYIKIVKGDTVYHF